MQNAYNKGNNTTANKHAIERSVHFTNKVVILEKINAHANKCLEI